MAPFLRVIVDFPRPVCRALPVRIGRVGEDVSDVSIAPMIGFAGGFDNRVNVRVVPKRANANQRLAVRRSFDQLVIGTRKTLNVASERRIVAELQNNDGAGINPLCQDRNLKPRLLRSTFDSQVVDGKLGIQRGSYDVREINVLGRRSHAPIAKPAYRWRGRMERDAVSDHEDGFPISRSTTAEDSENQ